MWIGDFELSAEQCTDIMKTIIVHKFYECCLEAPGIL